MPTAMAATTHDSMGKENIRIAQLKRPSKGIKGNKGVLNFAEPGIFFLNLIAEKFTII